MLHIVKATFPSRDFDNLNSVSNCNSPENEVDEVFCKWRDASLKLQRHRSVGDNIEEEVKSLLEVGTNLFSFSIYSSLVERITLELGSNLGQLHTD
jgi:hypothetical protein